MVGVSLRIMGKRRLSPALTSRGLLRRSPWATDPASEAESPMKSSSGSSSRISSTSSSILRLTASSTYASRSDVTGNGRVAGATWVVTVPSSVSASARFRAL